jgi:hypothetical protein
MDEKERYFLQKTLPKIIEIIILIVQDIFLSFYERFFVSEREV